MKPRPSSRNSPRRSPRAAGHTVARKKAAAAAAGDAARAPPLARVERRQGDKETRRKGDESIPLSPCPRVPLSCLAVHLCRRRVMLRRVANPRQVPLGHLPFHLCRLSHDDAAGGNVGPFGHNTADSDNAAPAYFRSI